MSELMSIIYERDASAYDAFREGLFQIGAPKHVTDLLPDMKKERVDIPIQIQSGSIRNNQPVAFLPVHNHVSKITAVHMKEN